MSEQIDFGRLVDTVRGQLECDRFLGGRWLPIGELEPCVPVAQGRAEGSEVNEQEVRAMTQTTKAAAGQATEKARELAAIGAEINKCQQCDLGKTRRDAVPGEGNADARIVFVGEAPGATEDEQGRPFVGRAGNLLTKIIEAMGLRREDVFIMNILKCRPPNNRDPQATEIAACEDYLYRQLQVIEPEVIVALGAHAARTLLQTTQSIGALRGRFHEYVPGVMGDPIKLLATYHPAYLLRNYSDDNRRRVWEDMQTVLRELGLPVPRKQR